MMRKTDAAVLLVKQAVDAGIKADYVLMDTWFTTEPMVKELLSLGLHSIGMVKQLKQRYTYHGRQYKLSELRKFVDFKGAQDIFGSLFVTTKTGIPVKIVFVRIYGNRWSIECFFQSSKSFLKLGTEFQSRSYDAMVSHTAIVFTRYTILEWFRRNRNDHKTFGELFFLLCEDIQDMDLTNALQSLMALFGNLRWES